MRNLLHIVCIMFACALACAGCRESQLTDDPTLRLSFSQDTVRFDTVFTSTDGQEPSATIRVMVYNRNREAIMIDRVWMDNGKWFRANVDGEAELSRLTRLQINGGDSAFVFVHVGIDKQNQADAVWVTDALHMHLSTGATQSIQLEAYGQDVVRIRTVNRRSDYATYHFTAEKPYLVYDTLVVGELTIDAGARIYMHSGAGIYALGNVKAQGTLDQPITICGDRLDNLFDSVPYRYASGGWNGVYLQTDKSTTATYDLSYVDILSGNIGLYCVSERTESLPRLTMTGCRIHNHAMYGLVLLNVDATVANTEISNCASYCVYSQGGTHRFVHSTIASYYGYTNIRIHSTGSEDVAAVYINNLSKEPPQTVCGFENCIITGARRNQVVVATPFDQYYPSVWQGNYLKCDTLRIPHARQNVYWQETDTADVFRQDFYRYREYKYYDFRLDSLSPAIGIGLTDVAAEYPTDRLGQDRTARPDAGAYQGELKIEN